MAFQFGTNWEVLARMAGPIQGVLLSYETFTAFFLEASFFGILVFGRYRVPPWFYLFSTAMVALGTSLSAFWIMANNSWMQVPVGYAIEKGDFVPTDWAKILFSPVLWVRFPAYAARILSDRRVLRRGDRRLVSAAREISCRGANHASHGALSRGRARAGPAVLRTLQRRICRSHHQPTKLAAIEARWHDEKPGFGSADRLAGCREPAKPFRDHAAPPLGSLIDSDSLSAEEVGLDSIPPRELATGSDPILHLPHHGRLRCSSCCRRLGRILFEPQGTPRAKSPAALGDILELSAALHRDIDGLVHRRSWPAALGGLWRAQDRRRDDALPDSAHGNNLARCILRRLHLHLRLRGLLHLSAYCASDPVDRLVQPPAAAIPNRPMSVVDEPIHAELAITSSQENSRGHVLGVRPGSQHLALRSA